MTEQVVYYQINKDHAYWTEKRRLGQREGGHTAGLLSHIKDGVVVTNILFDAGLGTIDGLHDLAGFSWRDPLAVFVTHGHIDHHAELMVLSELWCRRAKVVGRPPLDVYCTVSADPDRQATYDSLLQTHSFGFGGGRTLNHIAISPTAPVNLGIFTVNCVDVADHFRGAVIYVVEFDGRKLLVAWDMRTLPDPDQAPVLKRPSLALVEANTWTALSHRTGHTSVEELVGTGFLQKLDAPGAVRDPYGIFLVHYGGGEDPGGAMSDLDLELKFRHTYPGLAPWVGVARRGQTWAFRL